MKAFWCSILVGVFAQCAWAYDPGEVFLDPHVAVGYNVVQGTYFLLGADAGYALTDQIAAGVGAFYSFGKRPEHDRTIGAGPFVAYVQPIVSFLTASVREDIPYVDQRTPVLTRASDGSESFDHIQEHGVESITSVGLHLRVGRVFGISGGYRALIPLSNTNVAKDRSGTFLGFSIGF